MPEKSQSIYFQPLANRRLRSLSMKAVCFFHIAFAYYPVNTASAGNFQQLFGSVVALPAIVEKGYIDVHLSVASPGGHSSIPPKHTVRTVIPYSSNGLLIILCPEHRPFGRFNHRD